MSWSRFQAFLKSLVARVDGSYVALNREQPTRLSSWAEFPQDERLAIRLKAARDLIGDRPVVADRKMIQDQPDFGEPRGLLSDWARDGNGSPIDFDNDGFPNG